MCCESIAVRKGVEETPIENSSAASYYEGYFPAVDLSKNLLFSALAVPCTSSRLMLRRFVFIVNVIRSDPRSLTAEHAAVHK